jgi:nucleoside-triphosphatase
MKNPTMNRITLLTGPRGSGKTNWCVRFLSRSKEKVLDVGGMLSPAVFHDGRKIGIDLLHIPTGEQRPLARKGEQSSEHLRLGDWWFNSATLDWGNRVLDKSINHDLILLDELGPLEFEKGLGLVAGLKLIDEKNYRHAVVVIRPELLQTAQIRWPDAEIVDISCVETLLHPLERERP